MCNLKNQALFLPNIQIWITSHFGISRRNGFGIQECKFLLSLYWYWTSMCEHNQMQYVLKVTNNIRYELVLALHTPDNFNLTLSWTVLVFWPSTITINIRDQLWKVLAGQKSLSPKACSKRKLLLSFYLDENTSVIVVHARGVAWSHVHVIAGHVHMRGFFYWTIATLPVCTDTWARATL